MMHKIILLSIISIDVLILLFQTSSLSISSHEAALLYGDFSSIQFIENLSLSFFGQNDLSLRIPMIFFHLLSVILMYKISDNYLADQKNRIWLLLIFILLPGVLSSALLVDSAGLIILGLLLYVYVYENFSIPHTYPILLVFSLVDGVFIYLFISLVVYSIYIKNKAYLFANMSFLITSIYFYGITTEGSPEGHLIDTVGLYSAIFTPIIFTYIFYVLYRRFLSKEMNVLWFISTIPLLISLLLSFRQNIYIEDFAPYLIVALPLAAQSFYAAYRVRLKMFRTRYKIIFGLSALFLSVNFIFVLFNRELYLVIEKPQKHFARKMHIAKELAQELKSRDIYCVTTQDTMGNRLKFYGITSCTENLLIEKNLDVKGEDYVTISYKYRPIYKAIVTNLNTL
ncbi:MAG: hypothetical protein ACI9TV_002892 [Sulfurimonas sp.]|jgi:hypothetical protein|uniref:hypothetical protein n=1 Tax=Sulfurimonas sp. TaxID=2022749 RepID=UPI0039E241AE